jgi:hypothetical protein
MRPTGNRTSSRSSDKADAKQEYSQEKITIRSSALNQFNETRTYNECTEKPVDERVVHELHDLVNGVDRRPIPVRLDRSALRARKSSLRHRTREWSVLLSPAPSLANILGVRRMQSP